MEMNQDSHYVSFLAENAASDDEERCQPRASVRGSVSQSLREVMASVGNSARERGDGGNSSRSFSSFPSYYFRQLQLSWRKFERTSSLKVRLLIFTILAAIFILAFTAVFLNSSLPAEDIPSFAQDNINGISDGTTHSPYAWKEEHYVSAFDRFQKQFNRKYVSDEEKERRYNIFKHNQSYINLQNTQGRSYKLAMNDFGDLTNEEFRRLFVGGYKRKKGMLNVAHDLLDRQKHAALPESVDWRTKNCVTPVKNQKMCGSCWAFSVTGAVEGNVCAKTGNLPSLSEQQLVDCGGPEGNHGCNGGQMEYGFQYILHAGGICSEDDYPYLAKDDTCKAKDCKPVAQVTGFKNVPEKSIDAMKTALFESGPVSVAIEADQMAFQFYSGGVFDDVCGTVLDHGVLAVGYGKDEASGKRYWIVKNSWGSAWGDQGYIKMAMDKGEEGMCGILLDGSYPTV